MQIILIIAGFIFVLMWYFARTGTVKYQVRFYLKKYADARRSGRSHDLAIEELVEFFNRRESPVRQKFFQENLPEFKKNIDLLIGRIITSYFIEDRLEKEPIMIFTNPAKYNAMMSVIPSQCERYLALYKQKFGIK